MLMPPADLLRRYRPTRYVPSAPYVKRFPRDTWNANTTDLLDNADIAYTAYSIPTGYTPVYIDVTNGLDSRTLVQAQNSATPWQTLEKFMVNAPDLSCAVFLTSGTYYLTNAFATSGYPLTIDAAHRYAFQPAAGVKAWIDGRFPATVQTTGWTVLGGGRWSIAGWDGTVPNTRRFMNGSVPAGDMIAGGTYNDANYQLDVDTTNGRYAAYPDLITYGNKVLKWAANAASVVSGTFFLDYVGGTMTMTVGDDPTVAGQLRCAAMRVAFNFQGLGIVRGLGIRCFATHNDDGGMVYFSNTGADRSIVENCTLVYARAGIGIRAVFGVDSLSIQYNTCAYNGGSGFGSSGTINSLIRYNSWVYNNWNRQANGTGYFKHWAFAGCKSTNCANDVWSDNFIAYNNAPGMWWDVGCSDITITRNEIAYNRCATIAPQTAHGIFWEESARGTIVDNIIHDNDGRGILISQSSDSEPRHNTIYNNAMAEIDWNETAQSDTPDQYGIDRGVTMNVTNGHMVANILSRPGVPLIVTLSTPLLRVVNARAPVPANTGASAMLNAQDYNLYHREIPTAAILPNVSSWRDDGASADTFYTTLAAHQAAAGTWREAHGQEADNWAAFHPYFAAPERGDFRLITGSLATTLVPPPVPPGMCTRLGIPKGSVPDIGSFHRGRSARLTYFAQETFNRPPASSTWGTADYGGAWTIAATPADFSTDGFVGKISLTAASTTREAYLALVAPRDTTARVRFKIEKLPVGGDYTTSIVLRRSTVANYEYRARLRYATSGNLYVGLTKLEGSGTESLVGSETQVAGITVALNTWYWLQAVISGTGTVTVTLKGWQDLSNEPNAVTATVVDSTPHANLQVAGYVGLLGATGSGVSNTPVNISFNELDVYTSPTYTWYDGFTTAQAGPIAQPRTMEVPPGVTAGAGSWATIRDDESKTSIANKELVLGKHSTATASPSLWTASTARTMGLAYLARARQIDSSGAMLFGYDSDNGLFLNGNGYGSMSGTNLTAQIASTGATNAGLAVWSQQVNPIDLAVVMLDQGCLYLAKYYSASVWTVVWVDLSQTAAMFPSLGNVSGTTGYFRDARLLDLRAIDARALTRWGTSLVHLASPSAAASATAAADADLDVQFTQSNATIMQAAYRYQDANNHWRAEARTNGDLALVSNIAGVATDRILTAGIFTNATAYRLVVRAVGNVHQVWAGIPSTPTYRNAYTDAGNNFNTQTGLNLIAVGGGVSELNAWPRTLTLPRI